MNNTLNETKLAFIGCGVMAESIIGGLLRHELVRPEQICGSHPREDRRNELKEKFGINTFAGNANAAASAGESADSMVVLCTKPQKIDKILDEIAPAVSAGQIVISIVAGTRIKKISKALGTSKVVRSMPNTPSQIGHGITAWTCTEELSDAEKAKVKSLLTALGRELFVETENMIDMATSLSATGPTYIFLVMEALTDAGVHLGFSRDMSKELVQETMLGAVLFAIESDQHPAELRNMVTSPGGTSAGAIYQMEKGGLRTVLSKAVFAAYQRAVELGKDD